MKERKDQGVLGGRDVGPAIVDRRGSEATSICGDGGSRAGSDAEEMQVAEVEVEAKVGGSGTFGWPKRKTRKKGRGRKKNGRGGAK